MMAQDERDKLAKELAAIRGELDNAMQALNSAYVMLSGVEATMLGVETYWNLRQLWNNAEGAE